MKRGLLITIVGVIVFFFAIQEIDDNKLKAVKSAKTENEVSSEATILFGGDMMFDRYIREVSQRKGNQFLFSCIGGTLNSTDAIVANLEGPITSFESVSLGSVPGGPNNYTFTFPTSTAALLKRNNISILNIGNNHSNDFGIEGARETVLNLAAEGLDFFGGSVADVYLKKEINGIEFAFINYNQFSPDLEQTIQEIKKANKEGYIPVVFTHWGEEYVYSQPWLSETAHSFIDNGAELVIGTHPHIVGEVEEYKGKYIFYSLGNFIFDQYFDEKVKKGLLIKGTFDDQSLRKIDQIKIEMLTDGRTCVED